MNAIYGMEKQKLAQAGHAAETKAVALEARLSQMEARLSQLVLEASLSHLQLV